MTANLIAVRNENISHKYFCFMMLLRNFTPIIYTSQFDLRVDTGVTSRKCLSVWQLISLEKGSRELWRNNNPEIALHCNNLELHATSGDFNNGKCWNTSIRQWANQNGKS